MLIKPCLAILQFILLACWLQPAHADGHGPEIQWGGWSAYSNEIWNRDRGPLPKFPLRYPLTNLFDGNPATAWAFEDGQKPVKNAEVRPSTRESAPNLTVFPDKPVEMDGVWLMNGYNRRPELFHRNDRIVRLTISINEKKVKDVFLTDTMGWHKISIPRQRVRLLLLEFTGIRKGNGADHDLCVSELAFSNRGRRIAMRMPQAVIYTLSWIGGGTNYFMNRNGKVLAKGSWYDALGAAWNPRGSLVAGVEWIGRKQHLWIADATKPRIKRSFYPSGGEISRINWSGDRTVEVTIFDRKLKRETKQSFRV